MKLLFFLSIGFVLTAAHAAPDVNSDDKKDQYQIIVDGKTLGEVIVSSVFVGQPVIESTKIEVTVNCSAGYKLNSRIEQKQSFKTYDYGAGGKLSQWDAKKNELTIFHRTALIKDGSPVIHEEKTIVSPLVTACVKK